MKRWLSLFVALPLLLTSVAGQVQAQDFQYLAVNDLPTVVESPDQNRSGMQVLAQPSGLKVADMSLSETLLILGKRAGVHLAFSRQVIPSTHRVTCDCEALAVAEALDRILRGTSLKYRVVGSHIVIEPVSSPHTVQRSPLFTAHLDRASGRPLANALIQPVGSVRAVSSASRSIAEIRQGEVVGLVTDRTTGEPVSAIQISLEGTQIGVLSGADGRFVISNVPAGTYNLLAQRLGYQQYRQEGVTVTSGETTTVDFTIAPAVLALQGVVATGLVDPVEGVRSPISVSRIDRELMPSPVAGSAVQNLQGMMPGVTIGRRSGQPGQEAGVMLRSPTSVLMNNDPLIVVDGVILGTSGTVNIESMDIEAIEVIRGASAASLYGSRAAAGVIAITTNRGAGLAMGETRFTARSEMGVSTSPFGHSIPRHHYWFVDDPDNPTTYVDASGNPVSRENRTSPTNPSHRFMVNAYPTPIYDNLSSVFQGGNYNSQNFSILQNTEATNFAITLNRMHEAGALENNDGYERSSFRVNLDHRMREALTLGVSAFHSRDFLDDLSFSSANLRRAPVDVNLGARDEAGNYIRIPDPEVPYVNPLWEQASEENERRRIRTLASSTLRWEPVYWLSFMGNVSYDREDARTRVYVPKGTPTSPTQPITTDGSLTYNQGLSDTWNAEAQISLRRDFGLLNARTTFRGLLERDRNEIANATGQDFSVSGVPRMNVAQSFQASSLEQEVRSEGYLWDTALDYDAKYILTGLLRRDGSSLFGPDNRWHTYYRGAAAWRMAEEEWFNLPHVDEFKLSFARGTAGGRPNFAAQYETWSVAGGVPRKTTLGNRNLRPEHTTESEVSLDMILGGRVGIDVTYAWQKTEDQILQLALPAVTGYTSQWSNAGVVEGSTWEMSLESQLMATPRFSWMTLFIYDHSTSRITEWNTECITPGDRFRCTGVGLLEIWAGPHILDHPNQLLEYHHGGAAASRAHEFQRNDEGWLVWVGEGNNYWEGFEKDLWGTSTFIDGVEYQWGYTIKQLLADGSNYRGPVGDGVHHNFGWVNNFRYGNLSFTAHMQAKVGGGFMYGHHRSMIREERSPLMDQRGKPRELWKPADYYVHFEGGRGSRAWVEPADYLKLRTLSVNYRLNQNQLQNLGLARLGMETMQIGVVGRNLLSLHPSMAADPEQGLNLADLRQQQGSGEAAYPNMRHFTMELEVTF